MGLHALPLVLSLGATGWALSTNPLAAPLVERTGTDLILSLERSVRRGASEEWIDAALRSAMAAEDAERAAMLVALADDLDRPVDTDLRAAAATLAAARAGWSGFASDCAACVADVAQCPSTDALLACAVPFELSPLGDANALRRAASAWAAGADVDRFEAGLAALGLGATAAAVTTGGATLPIKAGAGLMRMARRMGTVTPGLQRLVSAVARPDRAADVVRGTAPVAALVDAGAAGRLRDVAADLGRVREAAGTAPTLRLLRVVDGPADARGLARTATAMGPRTERTFAVLGKARTMRAGLRLTRGAAAALILLWLTAVQFAVALAGWLGGRLLRTVLR